MNRTPHNRYGDMRSLPRTEPQAGYDKEQNSSYKSDQCGDRRSWKPMSGPLHTTRAASENPNYALCELIRYKLEIAYSSADRNNFSSIVDSMHLDQLDFGSLQRSNDPELQALFQRLTFFLSRGPWRPSANLKGTFRSTPNCNGDENHKSLDRVSNNREACSEAHYSTRSMSCATDDSGYASMSSRFQSPSLNRHSDPRMDNTLDGLKDVLRDIAARDIILSNPSLSFPDHINQSQAKQPDQFFHRCFHKLLPSPEIGSSKPLKIIDEESDISENESINSASTSVSDYATGSPSLGEGHPYLLLRPLVISHAIFLYDEHCFYRQHGNQARSNSQNTTPQQPERESPNTNQSGRNQQPDGTSTRKRKSDSNGETPRKRARAQKKDVGQGLSFACPFAKKNPMKYIGCHSYILKRLRDVKQHLSRHHQRPVYCSVCMEIFETEELRDYHTRALNCQLRTGVTYEGVTREQREKLRKRGGPDTSEEWFIVFDILFPNHLPRPKSAYLDSVLTTGLEDFENFMRNEGPRIISDDIHSAGLHVSATDSEDQDLSPFLESVIAGGLERIAQRWWMENAMSFSQIPTSQPSSSNASPSSQISPASNDSSAANESPNTSMDDEDNSGMKLNNDQQYGHCSTDQYLGGNTDMNYGGFVLQPETILGDESAGAFQYQYSMGGSDTGSNAFSEYFMQDSRPRS